MGTAVDLDELFEFLFVCRLPDLGVSSVLRLRLWLREDADFEQEQEEHLVWVRVPGRLDAGPADG